MYDIVCNYQKIAFNLLSSLSAAGEEADQGSVVGVSKRHALALMLLRLLTRNALRCFTLSPLRGKKV